VTRRLLSAILAAPEYALVWVAAVVVWDRLRLYTLYEHYTNHYAPAPLSELARTHCQVTLPSCWLGAAIVAAVAWAYGDRPRFWPRIALIVTAGFSSAMVVGESVRMFGFRVCGFARPGVLIAAATTALVCGAWIWWQRRQTPQEDASRELR
jgi:hypothetical protein